ncbi:MAG: GDP-L-fucose synthase [Pseudomonadota bacterium]
MKKDAKIYVAGHMGLVGSTICRKLQEEGYRNVLVRSRPELDLMRQSDVEMFFRTEKPEYVFLAAAKVGGILANNTYPAEFIYNNLTIQNNIIHSSWKTGVKRLLFLGSSCIYPRDCPQPMKEDYLLTGPLEATNEPYAIAKIAGIKTCQSFNRQYGTQYVSVMPTNLFGPHDNFNLETSHVLPALIRKYHEAKVRGERTGEKQIVEIWGTGAPRREFLHVEDLADACCFIMNLDDSQYEPIVRDGQTPLINIGFGKDITIRELAQIIQGVVGFDGDIRFDRTKPDGTPQKLLDISKIQGLGWKPKISLKEGIRKTYNWCVDNSVFKMN